MRTNPVKSKNNTAAIFFRVDVFSKLRASSDFISTTGYSQHSSDMKEQRNVEYVIH